LIIIIIIIRVKKRATQEQKRGATHLIHEPLVEAPPIKAIDQPIKIGITTLVMAATDVRAPGLHATQGRVFGRNGRANSRPRCVRVCECEEGERRERERKRKNDFEGKSYKSPTRQQTHTHTRTRKEENA